MTRQPSQPSQPSQPDPSHSPARDRASLLRIFFWLVLAVVLGGLAVVIE